MFRSLVIMLVVAGGIASAQENALQADFRREGEHFRESCGKLGFKTFAGCAPMLLTDHPLHIAVGSIAPQNGFGFGGAFVTHYTPSERWRLSWNFDAVVSTNASWRAGAYMKIIHTPVVKIRPVVLKPGEKPPTLAIHPYTVFNLYAQSISLNKLNYFGLGNTTAVAGKSLYGMQETIVGVNAIKPVTEWSAIRKVNLSLLGEVNGRFVDLRGNHGSSTPSIEALYTEVTAPGLTSQPGFVQLGQGVRIKPVLGEYFELNYFGNFQEFFAPSNSHYSFLRWTVDLGHRFLLYGHTGLSDTKDFNGPNECAPAVGAQKCPPMSFSRNLDGSIGVRLLISESINSASSVVPFFFQPTLGGSDINGAPYLSSYQDYRFRRAEHSFAAGELRALDLGTVRIHLRGRPGQSRPYTRGCWLRSLETQLRRRTDAARRRPPCRVPHVLLGWQRGDSHDRHGEHVAVRGIGAAVPILT